jgi:FKBP-type peptidyl-prolyl cis-trans isomerase
MFGGDRQALDDGQSFLGEYAQRDGVQATRSGLMFRVLTEGRGSRPVATDSVKVHYEGSLINGTVFDSSYQRGEPISFPLDGVIAGWTEGVQLMAVGAKYEFCIPYSLAYGEKGQPPQIPRCANLLFQVELLEIH